MIRVKDEDVVIGTTIDNFPTPTDNRAFVSKKNSKEVVDCHIISSVILEHCFKLWEIPYNARNTFKGKNDPNAPNFPGQPDNPEFAAREDILPDFETLQVFW